MIHEKIKGLFGAEPEEMEFKLEPALFPQEVILSM